MHGHARPGVLTVIWLVAKEREERVACKLRNLVAEQQHSEFRCLKLGVFLNEHTGGEREEPRIGGRRGFVAS